MKIEDGKRVYLVLHGINGNSNEGYVVDFVHQQVSQGNVVAGWCREDLETLKS